MRTVNLASTNHQLIPSNTSELELRTPAESSVLIHSDNDGKKHEDDDNLEIREALAEPNVTFKICHRRGRRLSKRTSTFAIIHFGHQCSCRRRRRRR